MENTEVIMRKKTKYVDDGMCIEETCNKRYTNCAVIRVNGLDLFINLCDEHAEIWDKEVEKKVNTWIFRKKKVE